MVNTLLQILDDGRPTDALATVNFRNTVIIMTSNIGSLFLLDGDRHRRDRRGRPGPCDGRTAHAVPSEFLNRVDEIVLFKPITLGEIEQIVDLQTRTSAVAWRSGASTSI